MICSIESRQFREVLSMKTDLAVKYIDMVTLRLREVEELLEYMAYASVRKRLLFLLNKLLSKFSSTKPKDTEASPEWARLDIELTHQELASMAGSIRETVSSLLSQLEAEGILRREGSRKPLWIHRGRLQIALKAPS